MNRAATSETPDSADPSANKADSPTATPQENLPPQTAKAGGSNIHAADLTGIFRKVPSERPEDLPPASARNGGREEPGPRPGNSGHAEEAVEVASGFTEIFQSLSRNSDTRSSEAGKEPHHAEPMQRDSWPQQSSEVRSSPASPEFHHPDTPKEGEFTGLFRNLSNEDSRMPGDEQAMPRNAAAPVSQRGGFTQLLRTLSAEDQEAAPLAEKQPMASTYAAAEPLSSGPGEFTRIISGSLLREAQGRTMPSAPPRTPPASSAAPEITVPASASLPAASPAMPLPSPVSAPILTPEQLVAPLPAVPAAPVLPAAPAALPATQIQSQTPGTLQRYIPLLLIANLFVLVLILIAVIVALLHR
jgi:hypothetical protein